MKMATFPTSTPRSCWKLPLNIDRNHIEAFYKTAGGKFVIVLTNADLKETYSLGINFREQVENMSLNIRLSPTLQRFKERQPYYGSRRDTNTVFVTMYLPSTISDIAVRKAFMQFGDVHTVFARQFKDDLYGIHNGKGHIP